MPGAKRSRSPNPFLSSSANVMSRPRRHKEPPEATHAPGVLLVPAASGAWAPSS